MDINFPERVARVYMEQLKMEELLFEKPESNVSSLFTSLVFLKAAQQIYTTMTLEERQLVIPYKEVYRDRSTTLPGNVKQALSMVKYVKFNYKGVSVNSVYLFKYWVWRASHLSSCEMPYFRKCKKTRQFLKKIAKHQLEILQEEKIVVKIELKKKSRDFLFRLPNLVSECGSNLDIRNVLTVAGILGAKNAQIVSLYEAYHAENNWKRNFDRCFKDGAEFPKLQMTTIFEVSIGASLTFREFIDFGFDSEMCCELGESKEDREGESLGREMKSLARILETLSMNNGIFFDFSGIKRVVLCWART